MTPTGSERAPAWAAGLALIAITAVWGTTFALIKLALVHIPPLEFMSIRFWIAVAVMSPLLLRGTALRLPKSHLRGAAFTGMALAAGYAFQTIGLQFTAATKSSLITGLFVVFTPILAAVLLRERLGIKSLAGVAMAGAGLVLLTTGPSFAFNRGDAITLVVPILFAAHILLVDRFTDRIDPIMFGFLQMLVAAVVLTPLSFAFEEITAPSGPVVWTALLVTGVFASALAFAVMSWAQRVLSPTQTAVVCTMEPVFATATGVALLAERPSLLGWLGAALIVGATLLVAAGEPAKAEAL